MSKEGKRKTLIDELIESGVSELITETKPIINLSEKATKKQRVKRWATSVTVPQDSQILLREIDLKLAKLGAQSLDKGEIWYTGLLLLNELLNYVDKNDIDENDNISDYLLNKIKSELTPPHSK